MLISASSAYISRWSIRRTQRNSSHMHEQWIPGNPLQCYWVSGNEASLSSNGRVRKGRPWSIHHMNEWTACDCRGWVASAVNAVTRYWMGLTKNVGHQFHVEHAHLINFVAPHLLHPPKICAVINPNPCVGEDVCESVTILSPALFTLWLQLHHQDKIFEVMHKLTSVVLKSSAWKLR